MTFRTRTARSLIAMLAIALAATLAGTASAHFVIAPGHPAVENRASMHMTLTVDLAAVEPRLDQLNALREALTPFEHVDAALDVEARAHTPMTSTTPCSPAKSSTLRV